MMESKAGEDPAGPACRAVPFAATAEPALPLPARRAPVPHPMVFLRAGLVAAAALWIVAAVSELDAPAFHAAGPLKVIAHADASTRVPARLHPLADRVVAIRERASQSRTFALSWARTPDGRDAGLAMQARALGTGAPPLAFTARPQARHFRVLASATVLDGRTLTDGAFRIRLRDVALPAEQDTCLLLNGERQPCSARLATQLELMVRWRQVVCEYEPVPPASAQPATVVGACRIGNTDIATRLAEIARRTPRVERIANADTGAAL